MEHSKPNGGTTVRLGGGQKYRVVYRWSMPGGRHGAWVPPGHVVFPGPPVSQDSPTHNVDRVIATAFRRTSLALAESLRRLHKSPSMHRGHAG